MHQQLAGGVALIAFVVVGVVFGEKEPVQHYREARETDLGADIDAADFDVSDM